MGGGSNFKNYDNAELEAAGITDTTKLNLYFWNGTQWKGILPCAGCSVNTADKTVTAVLDHFTELMSEDDLFAESVPTLVI